MKDTTATTLIFAFIGFTHVVSALIYLYLTRNFGNPLKDSLSEDQLIIRKESARKRRRAFYYGMGIAVLLFIIVHQLRYI